ncbi:MAG: hypothetical protein ACK514_10455 [Bacteroidota bacterium]
MIHGGGSVLRCSLVPLFTFITWDKSQQIGLGISLRTIGKSS